MKSLRFLGQGLRQALRHPGLILLAWSLTLIPALLVVGTTSPIISSPLDDSLFADEVLTSDWVPVWLTVVLKSNAMAMKAPSRGAGLALLLVLGLQILLAAIMVERLLERHDPGWRPDWPGIRRTTLRFVRSAVWFGVSLVLVVLLAGVVFATFTEAAAEQRNGWLDLVGVALAAVLFLILFIPLDLAYDLSRIASARHDDGATARGYLRALWAVLRRPRLFLLLYAGFLVLPAALGGLVLMIQLSWSAASGVGLLVLVLLQQLVMLGRAYFKVAFWAAEIRCYAFLGEPRWCQSSLRRKEEEAASPVTYATPVIKTVEPGAP